jgi:hypothetical protein
MTISIYGWMKPNLGLETHCTGCLDIILKVSVYTRYVGEQHVREDCNNYIPSAKEWVNGLFMEKKPLWMTRTMKINTD